MAQAKSGDSVRVHYTGKLADGTVFDSSRDREPLEFTIGDGNIISGFEQAVVGMTPGQSLSATIPASEAYGERDNTLVWEVEKDKFPPDLELEVGQQLQSIQDDGQVIRVFVAAISEGSVTLDANHPLAGQDLQFDIELVEIL